ncbi:hypothetical protein ABZ896_31340 [Streptomyces sp. NPDC047072]|uniref:hypothetical protein n=1 Tax=Streptomyces sp. NPDC047072 TaxID=3154809 RepID=UPI0033F57901
MAVEIVEYDVLDAGLRPTVGARVAVPLRPAQRAAPVPAVLEEHSASSGSSYPLQVLRCVVLRC